MLLYKPSESQGFFLSQLFSGPCLAPRASGNFPKLQISWALCHMSPTILLFQHQVPSLWDCTRAASTQQRQFTGLPTALYTNGDIPFQKGFVFVGFPKPADSGHPEEQHSVPVRKHQRLAVQTHCPRTATCCYSRERPFSRAPQKQTVHCVFVESIIYKAASHLRE